MPKFHHVNLGVPPGGIDAEASFILDVLGYRRLALTEAQQGMGVNWFEADDGSQIHLSEDPEHQPAARAHVALEFGDQITEIDRRLTERSWHFDTSHSPDGRRTLLCKDPSGNKFELRGTPGA